MASCGVCIKSIAAKQIKLTCKECGRDFHGSCLKMSKADVECIMADGMVWRCDPCAKERRKSMQFESEATDGKKTLEDILEVVREIKNNQIKIEKEFNTSYEMLHSKLDENTKVLQDQNETIDRYMKMIEELTTENRLLKKQVLVLENRIEDIEQYSRSNAVEIHGIPQVVNEDVVRVVQDVGRALNMDIEESMIDACHRLGRGDSNGRQPGIIVKFVRRLDKEELLRKRRVKRNLSTAHMNLPLDQPIYINEALSPARRRLYAMTRNIKKEKSYKYLWTRGGKIFLRKEDGAPVIHVTCQADLDKL